MTDTMPFPSSTQIPRNDSFSAAEIHQAFKASAAKPRNDRSLRVIAHDHDDNTLAVPPPSPLVLSRRTSAVLGWGVAAGESGGCRR